MEKEPGRRPGKCESCGLAMPHERGKGAWKYFCSNDGKAGVAAIPAAGTGKPGK